MQNILAFIKVSNNSLDDIDWLLSEIQTELLNPDGFETLTLNYCLVQLPLMVLMVFLPSATSFNAGGKTLRAGGFQINTML